LAGVAYAKTSNYPSLQGVRGEINDGFLDEKEVPAASRPWHR